MASLNDVENSISPLISEQFPAIYKEDSPLLVLFVKAYYEFLEQSDQSLGYSRNLAQMIDIDQATADFLEHFKKTYLFSIPNETTVDLSFLIKHILDLYRSKGSKRALELFFKLVYNKNADLYIPNEHLAKASDALYVTPKYIECYAGGTEILTAMVGQQITGAASGATAHVSSIVKTSIQGTLVDILFVENLVGEFIKNELVWNSAKTHNIRTNGSLSSITLSDGGNTYVTGQEMTVKSSANTSTEGTVRVASVADGTGVPAIVLQEGGSGFSTNSALSNVIVSSTILQVNNVSNTFTNPYGGANTFPANTFLMFETITSPKVTISFTSPSNTFLSTINATSYVLGLNSTSGVIANGQISASSPSISGATTNGNIIVYETSGSFASGVVKLHFAGNASVNSTFTSFTNSYITGTFIGDRTTDSIVGLTATSEVLWPSEQQGFIKGSQSNTVAQIVANRSGNNTVLSIATVGNTVATNVYTDFISFTNSGNVDFADMLINGTTSNVSAAGYGFPKSTSAGIDDVIDKSLAHAVGELLGEASSYTVTSSGNNYTSDPIILAQNRYVDSFKQVNLEILYNNRAGTTPEIGDILKQYKTLQTKTLTFSTSIGTGNFAVGEGIKQVVNSTTNTYAQVRSITNTTHMVVGNVYQSNTSSTFRTVGHAVAFTNADMTGLLGGNTANTIASQSNTSEIATAVGKLLTSNTANNSMTVRMHSIENDFYVTSTTAERLETDSNLKSFNIVSINDTSNTYNRYDVAGTNANTSSNVAVGTGIIKSVDVISSGLRFKDGEAVTFKLGSNTQAVTGTAVANGTGKGIGFHKLRSGVLGEEFYIHDNNFFQQFSYQVLSEFELNKYEIAIKDVIHTAGYKLFGRAVVESENDASISVANSVISQA